MTTRVILGSLAAGVAMFIWGALSHMVFKIGDAGLRSVPDDGALVPVMQSSLKEPGIYFFPPLEHAPADEEAAMKKFEERYQREPAGLIVYRPIGGEQVMSGAQLGRQFGIEVLCALLAAVLLAWGGPASFLSRALFVTIAGTVGTLSVLLPWWNWYGFPGLFIGGTIVDRVVAFAVAGLVLGAIVKKPAAGRMTDQSQVH